MLTKISSMLDAVADCLEAKGLMKEAYDIDKVADEIEKTAFGYETVPEGRHKSDADIKRKYDILIEGHSYKGVLNPRTIPLVIRDIKNCAEGSVEDGILESYPGWGTEDFKVLLNKLKSNNDVEKILDSTNI